MYDLVYGNGQAVIQRIVHRPVIFPPYSIALQALGCRKEEDMLTLHQIPLNEVKGAIEETILIPVRGRGYAGSTHTLVRNQIDEDIDDMLFDLDSPYLEDCPRVAFLAVGELIGG